MRLTVSAVIVAVAMAATPAWAQQTGQTTGTSSSTQKRPRKPPAPKLPIGLRAFFIGEGTLVSASDSFKAVTGSAFLAGVGGGAEVLNIWKRLFARVGVTTTATDGVRAFVVDGEVIPTGVTIDIGMRTIEIGAGWRMHFAKRPKLVFYYGGSVLLVKYTEDSQFGAGQDNVDESFRGYSAQAGLEVVLWKWLTAAVEGQYRIVPDAIGAGGVSKDYGETDLGGAAIRGMIGVRFKK